MTLLACIASKSSTLFNSIRTMKQRDMKTEHRNRESFVSGPAITKFISDMFPCTHLYFRLGTQQDLSVTSLLTKQVVSPRMTITVAPVTAIRRFS